MLLLCFPLGLKRLRAGKRHIGSHRGSPRRLPTDSRWHAPTDFRLFSGVLQRVVTFPVDSHWNFSADISEGLSSFRTLWCAISSAPDVLVVRGALRRRHLRAARLRGEGLVQESREQRLLVPRRVIAPTIHGCRVSHRCVRAFDLQTYRLLLHG